VVLRGGKHLLLAVDGPAGGSEDDLAHAVLGAVLEEANRTEDVDLGVEVRLPDRAPHVHLGRLVTERLRREVSEDLGTPRTDVGLVESRPRRDVLPLARREVVDYGDLVTTTEQVPCHTRPDKPGSPGQKNPHLRSPGCGPWTKPLPEPRTS
jgi:hypothetical protein